MRNLALSLASFLVVMVVAASTTPDAGIAAPARAAHKVAAHKLAAGAPNPCAYQAIDVEQYGLKPYMDAPVIRSDSNHVLKAVLDIRNTNPSTTTIAGCPVTLRTYNGVLIGPTLRVKPGDTMDITVKNDLPGDSKPCHQSGAPMAGMDMIPAPTVYNVANLHTHGLHVSPSGISDNIFLKICPTETQNYEIQIPTDHPAGTFWYHSHLHGSTAMQVSSGMEGVIIVEGGLDDESEIKAAKEKTFLLQQISYDQTGKIPDYSVFTPTWWSANKRIITVNGQVAPLFTMQPGEVQRWRFIHGGVRETIKLRVSKHDLSANVPLNEIATDGNAMGRMDVWTNPIELEPGYRSDVLIKAPPLAPGETSVRYIVYSDTIPATQRLTRRFPRGNVRGLAALLNISEPAQIIAEFDVQGAPVDMALPTNAELAPYAPYKPITDAELTGQPQSTTFDINTADCSGSGPCKPCPTCNVAFMVDRYEYPNGPVRSLKLGTASEWTLEVDPESLAPVHPFHIHVNPFEMTRVGPDGADEVVWKDTLLVVQGAAAKYGTIRSRYTDFTGAFVLHCHILDHEDGGMMQEVDVVN